MGTEIETVISVSGVVQLTSSCFVCSFAQSPSRPPLLSGHAFKAGIPQSECERGGGGDNNSYCGFLMSSDSFYLCQRQKHVIHAFD